MWAYFFSHTVTLCIGCPWAVVPLVVIVIACTLYDISVHGGVVLDWRALLAARD